MNIVIEVTSEVCTGTLSKSPRGLETLYQLVPTNVLFELHVIIDNVGRISLSDIFQRLRLVHCIARIFHDCVTEP